MIVDVTDPVVGPLKIAGNPIKVSGVPDPARQDPAPQLDQHRDHIMQALAHQKKV
jgi:CoA:oxalate CoA-transferase